MRKLLLVVALLVMVPATTAVGGGGGGSISACPAVATGTAVSMLDSCFSGIAHFAPSGTSITISNDGLLPHTYTAVDGSFDTGQMQPGETFDLELAESAIIQVFCTLHGTADGAGMAGVLLVGDAEVGAVAATDVSAVKRAVAEENEILKAELERHAAVIANFAVAQAGLVRSVEGIESGVQVGTDGVAGSEPIVVNVPGQTGSDLLWVTALAGVAVGLGMAVAVRTRRSDGPSVDQDVS